MTTVCRPEGTHCPGRWRRPALTPGPENPGGALQAERGQPEVESSPPLMKDTRFHRGFSSPVDGTAREPVLQLKRKRLYEREGEVAVTRSCRHHHDSSVVEDVFPHLMQSLSLSPARSQDGVNRPPFSTAGSPRGTMTEPRHREEGERKTDQP